MILSLGLLLQGQDWLAEPNALPGSAGEKAVRQILDDALKIADRCSNVADREAIYKAVSDINAMMDALCELRAKGQVCRAKARDSYAGQSLKQV